MFSLQGNLAQRLALRVLGGSGFTTYAEKVLSYSPLAYWKLDETSGTTAADSSGNGYDGTYTNITLTSGAGWDDNYAPAFDGSTSYVNVYSTAFRDNFPYTAGSMVGWYRPAQALFLDGVGFRRLFQFRGATAQINIQRYATDLRIGAQHVGGGGGTLTSIVTYTDVPYGWLPYAMTWSEADDEMKWYLYGTQQGSTQTGLDGWSTDVLFSSRARLGEDWDGYLRDAQLYDRVLSASDISDLHSLEGVTASTYFACGDSKANDNDLWVSMLAETFSANEGGYWAEGPDRLGYSGQTAASVASNLTSGLAGYSGFSPAHCFVNVGANDQSQGSTESGFKDGLRSIIDQLLAKWPSTKVWVTKAYREDVATNPSPATVAGWVDDVMLEYGANVAVGNDETGWFQTGIATYSDDGAHYNDAGHIEAVNQWAAALGY